MGYLRPYHVYPNVPPAGLDTLEDAFERFVGIKAIRVQPLLKCTVYLSQ